MDIDSPALPPVDLTLLSYFPTHPDQFAWSDNVREHILARRTAMSGLFFDILLQLGGVPDPATIYPPDSIPALKHLLDAIESASYDDMKRDCLVYYLLKQSSDGRDERYIDEKVISPQYVALADAYWQLDNGINLDGAISKLSDARIVRNYTTKIIETLALDPDSASLIRKFVRTCKPPLAETSDIERYIVATAEHSVVEAWKYQRTFPDHYSDRKKLLHVLFTWVLTPKPKSQPLTQLLALPFSRYEEAALQDFAMHPPENVPPASVGVVRDMVCVRLIQSCKYAAAVRFVRQYPSSGVGARGTWSAERERIVKDILSIMPAVERDLLENELAALGEDTRIRTSSMGSSSANQSWVGIGGNLGASGSTDLGTSWEDIGHRTAAHAHAPRKSLGARPRTSLPNGIPAKPAGMFSAAGPSTIGQQPLSAQSTLISQNGTGSMSISMNSPAQRFPTFISTAESPASAARLFAQKAPHAQQQPKTNGVAKKNGFMTRNAFFEPAPARNPDPEFFQSQERHVVDPMASASPKRAPMKPTTRLPTPPRDDDAERTQESSPTDEEQQAQNTDGREERETPSVISIISESDKQQQEAEEVSDGEREEGLGYSIFNGAVPAMRTPSSGSTSPKNVRKSPSWRNDPTVVEGGSQRKKLKVAVPGAFDVEEDQDHEHENEHDLPSPTSANAERSRFSRTRAAAAPSAPATRGTVPVSRTVSGSGGVRRSTRKRAASPENSSENDAHHHVNISIPGTLFEEDEDDQEQGRHHHHQQTNGRTNINANVHRHDRRVSQTTEEDEDEGEEEADVLAPLPRPSERRNRRKTDPSLRALSNSNSNNNLRTPQRRTTRSLRSNSTEPDENLLVARSTGRPVRRSTRLQSAEVSPTAAVNASKMSLHVKGKDKDREGGRERRPKKSSRITAEAGATAVGRGSSASKRR